MQVKIMHGSLENEKLTIFNTILNENGSQFQLDFPEGAFWINKDSVWVRKDEDSHWVSGSKYKYTEPEETCRPISPEEDAILRNPLLKSMGETFERCFLTAIAKNNDYGGSNNDPFANFRNSMIAGVSVEKGILVRLMDKMSRVSTLLDKEAMVKDEAITDTIEDAINYLAIMKAYINLKNK